MSVKIVRAACPHDCPDACSMSVTVEDGVVTRVRGNPEHPFTRGALCAKVNDYERRAYHPDRVLHPMRRLGAKGEGRFERISWDEAVTEICDRFRDISLRFGSQAILPYSYAGNISLLNGIPVGDPFMHRLGATVLERTVCASTRSSAYIATLGPAVVDPESIVHARYILIWGCNVLTSNLHLWPFIREARMRGARVVVIDAYRTRTAMQADWFIGIRPGTDGALALALMHVILEEGLVDDDYVEKHTTGFDALATRVASFPPERVETLTGVSAADIRILAREFATIQPSIIRVGVAIERSAQGGQAFRAIFSLPALVGSWRHVGGGILEMPVWAFPIRWEVLSRPEWIRPGTRVVNLIQVGRALTGELELDPPIRAMLVYNANPVILAPEQERVVRGLAREDLFTVVSDLFVTDTARYADILLPATTVLEHFDLTFSWGHLHLQANLPAIEPLGEAVPNTELFRRLAAGMGFTDEWFRLGDEEMAREAIDWAAPAARGITLERIMADGWARLNLPGADSPSGYAQGGFPTPSGRVELRSSLIEQAGGPLVLSIFREGYEGAQQPCVVDPVPDYVPPAPGRYRLTLLTPKAHAFLNSQYSNCDRQRALEGAQPALLNSADARDRGVSTGQRVRIVNELGSFTAVADVRDDVVSGVVICPHGHWRSRGPTPNASTPAGLSDLGRGPTFSDALVEVEPLPRRLAGADSVGPSVISPQKNHRVSVEAPAPPAPSLGHVGRDAAAKAPDATERRAPG